MKVAVMQPYLFPYIGYFQLMNAVHEFIIYDNIQYTKKGWINRNRILINGADAYITFPLKKDSDYLDVKDRYLSDDWGMERKKILNRITESYRKTPHFAAVFAVLEGIVEFESKNLFQFILNSLRQINHYLDIKTPIVISSSIDINHDLKSGKKVMAICKARHADVYINPIGGFELYDKEEFKNEGIELKFLKTNNIVYPQVENEFIPFLSIIDVMMFNSKEEIRRHLQSSFTLQ
ncbi:MAG: WbqC family protein [Burkholderiales bacterium]|nr:WbqC family protein [Bacteroidia bacterium]